MIRLLAFAFAWLALAVPALAAPPVLQDLTLRRGALTRAGAGDVPAMPLMQTGGSPVDSCAFTPAGAAATHFTQTGCSTPVPTAAGVSAGLGSGPYTWSVTATNADGTSAAKTLTYTIAANVATVSKPADVDGTSGLRTVYATLLADKTVEIARGSFEAFNGNGVAAFDDSKQLFLRGWANHPAPSRITFTSEDPSNRSKLSQVYMYGAKRVDWTGVDFETWIEPPPCLEVGAACTNPQNISAFVCRYHASYGGACDDVTLSDFTMGAPADKGPEQWISGVQILGNTATPFQPATAAHVWNGRILRTFNAVRGTVITGSTFENLVVDRFASNAFFFGGTGNANNLFQDLIICRATFNPADPADHADYWQIGSPTTANYNNNILRRAVLCQGDGNRRGQGPYADDVSYYQKAPTAYKMDGAQYLNVLYDGAAGQGFHPDAGSGLVVRYVTIIRGDMRTSADNAWNNPGFNPPVGGGVVSGDVTKNVFMTAGATVKGWFPSMGTILADVSPIPGAISLTAPSSAALANYYAPFFAQPDVSDLDYASMTAEQIAAALRLRYAPKLNGSLKNPDGTYNGALFPNGAWNDGSIYGASAPTALTSFAPVSTAFVGQPVTVTLQANAPAASTITGTPTLSGASGTFSPATAVIGVGASSAAITFTPTGPGVAHIGFTNDRSLTGPAQLNLTISNAPTPPSSYTQTANRRAVTLGGAIIVTYELILPATETVTLTPAAVGISGVWSQPQIVIPFGQRTGTATFFVTALGSGTLTVTDDRGLTDPAGISIRAVRATRGQLLKLAR